jgi:hypothetical protein
VLCGDTGWDQKDEVHLGLDYTSATFLLEISDIFAKGWLVDAIRSPELSNDELIRSGETVVDIASVRYIQNEIEVVQRHFGQ